MNECYRNPCQNGGTCRPDDNGVPICTCQIGYHGEFCEKSYTCEQNPCKNGAKCVNSNQNGLDKFVCKCEKNYFGIDCGISITKEVCELNESIGCTVKLNKNHMECNVDDIEPVSQKPYGLACPRRCNLCESFICADSFDFCYIFTKTLKCGMFANVCKKTCGLC